jgi:hypothetical protein
VKGLLTYMSLTTNKNSRLWDWAILASSIGFFLWHARYQALYALGMFYHLFVLIFG